jgi:glycosyltransferase involved in cell wall biosynthesis
MMEDLRQSFGVAHGKVIANGLDAQRVRTMADQAAEPPPTSGPYIIAVGRLSAQKDYATLIRAFALARQRGMSQDLLIVGDGEERDHLQSLVASLSMDGHVHMVGHRDNPYPLMKRAALLALTSQWEGFAYVPLEAMALGVPCIATRSDGPEAILEGGRWGMLVPPGDVQRLAEAMLEMTGDEQRARFSRLALERAGQLTIEGMASEYRDVFMAEISRTEEPPGANSR